jgi:chemotaxis methyl-accepting protein methylase
MATSTFQTTLAGSTDSWIVRACVRAYLFQSRQIWNHLPGFVRVLSPARAYGRHVHALVRRYAERKQNHSTFFLRNRPEMELLRRLLDQKPSGTNIDVSVLACSKGAEAYSFLWTMRSARPDLKLHMSAVDISKEILEFAARGVYSCIGDDPNRKRVAENGDRTWQDQPASIFERMTDQEVEAIFDVAGGQAKIKPWLKERISWLCGDVADPQFVGVLGPQDIVVANRFLCHMKPAAAEACLRNIAHLVKPGGYLFVSGVDVDVRTKVAQDLGWKPVTDLIREIHEGDATSLRDAWPLKYWGLEPFCDDRPDWRVRYAAVFQIGEAS